MLLLARAQSLSGRPGDALVMLRRLAAMGIELNIVNGEDFRRVRALPGWAEVEAAIAAAPAATSAKPSKLPPGEPTTRTAARTSSALASDKPVPALEARTCTSRPPC